MPTASTTSSSTLFQIIKIILYIFAGLVLLLGLLVGISLIASANLTASNLLLPLQLLGSDIIINTLSPMLHRIFINIGIGVIILTLVFSILLYTSGRMIGHILCLEARIARIEARIILIP